MKFISLLLLIPSLCFGQDSFRKVNLKEINQVLADSAKYEHKQLLKRYLNADTTLTEDDFFYLYYGQSLQEKYSPYEKADNKKLNELLEKKDEHNEKDLEKILSLCNKMLEEAPFDIDTWIYITYANKRLNKPIERKSAISMYQGILKAIYSTGDGKTEETAFWTINVDNEYTMLRWLDLDFGGTQSLTQNTCDRLSLKKNDQDLEAMYFNVSILFGKMSQLFNKDKKK